jgi:arylformamidase
MIEASGTPETNSEGNFILLSHHLSKETPCYGGSVGLSIDAEKAIAAGHSCNTVRITMVNHVGTHLDYPSHFCETGKNSSDYSINDLTFKNNIFLYISKGVGGRLGAADIFGLGLEKDSTVQCVMIKTDSEKTRETPQYVFSSPIFGVDFFEAIFAAFPNTKIIGIDAISISSQLDREEGRRAHRFLLCEKGILILEDMKLADLQGNPSEIIIAPLLLSDCDGAPVTVLAKP